MKPRTLATAALLTTIGLSFPAQAENLQHISQLLSSKQCAECDLSGAGLVMANLSGANLAGADLSYANLSRANLTGANLSGANLIGASLNGANLSGANLTGANLMGTDIRDAYLVNTNLTGVRLDMAYIEGVIGLPNEAGTKEQFYNWAMAEAEKRNYVGAIEHFNRALTLDPNFAPAYLGRGLIYYRLGNTPAATQDAQVASTLFASQGNLTGQQTAENFITGMEEVQKAANSQGGSRWQNILSGIGSLLLRFLF